MPHVPQFVMVVVAVSLPSAGMPLQSAKPALQTPSVHAPPGHVVLAFARVHTLPHVPQFAGAVSEASQPSPSAPLQLPKPMLHVPIAHIPLAHVAVALTREHERPQPPQFVSVWIDVSQPVASLPSQSENPLRHEPMRHIPVEQSATAPERVHVAPHAPQSVSVWVDVSQPSAVRPLQSAKPAAHAVIVHVPLAQLPVACAGTHATPQPPQLMSVFVIVSQPSAVMPLQLPKPGRQPVSEHAPAAHDAVPLANEQGTPHAPQFVSVRVEVVQPVSPGHIARPALHVVTRQVPVLQSPVPPAGAQMLLHVPQLMFVVSGDSQPLLMRPSQSPQCGSHVVIAQVPVLHDVDAFGALQRTPQAPQLVAEVSGVSQPFIAFMSQLPKPGSQSPMAHEPMTHVGAVECASEHAAPHAPQSVAVLMLASQPSLVMWLQSAQPPSQSVMLHAPIEQTVPDTWFACGQSIAGSPSSIIPLQLSSTPLQISCAPMCTAGFVSLQSVPRQPTPVP